MSCVTGAEWIMRLPGTGSCRFGNRMIWMKQPSSRRPHRGRRGGRARPAHGSRRPPPEDPSETPPMLRIPPVRRAEPSRHLFQPAEEVGKAVSVEGEVAGVGAFGVADADAEGEGGKFHAFTGSARN